MENKNALNTEHEIHPQEVGHAVPIAEATSATLRSAEPIPQSAISNPHSSVPQSIEILIVEDSPLEAEMLRRILVRAGYRVAVAKNGEEGLQALREHPCTLVMSDINMPLMDGYELCHAIKLDEKLWHTPVILVTALSESKDIIKALDVGADGYITKPYIEDILLGRIRSLLANPARRKLADERRKIQLEYGGEKHDVAVDSPQMANLLLSVYENSLILNQELMHIQNQLNLFNETLEEKVRERTADMQENEEKLRAIFESVLDGILLADTETRRFASGNPAICQMLGYSSEEIMQLGVADIHPQQALPHVVEQFEKQLRGETQLAADIPVKRKDGSVFYADIKSSLMSFGGRNYLLGIFRDITERKQAEAKILATQAELQRLLDAANQSRRAMLSVIQDQKKADAATQHANRALATLSAVNSNLVRATDENELLQAICDAIVGQRGYRMAWVGYKQHDESKSIKIMAHAGEGENYLDGMQLTWAESEHGMWPSGRAIRNGATQLCQDIANDPLFLPWRDAALKCGYAASISLPLLNGDGMVFGILNVHAAEANAFIPAEIALLEEMAGDLAFGVLTLHTRRQRDLALEQNQRQLVQLRDSLEDTVRAMAGLVEMRDPYTAGHQARVADLAAAIARQMGLPDEQAHAIHLAGTVHDLGKINIPAEILSKPGKITDIDFNLIKTHPQAGYDILQGIDFPWPIAQMVLQHHERLDGSGYPQGHKGDAILLEARILSVADVVEAISAHRPYRPGFGIEIALAEITKMRGIHFDPAVVDACLTLFREQGYRFR